MKLLHLVALLVILLLCLGMLPLYAAQIYLPDTEEVGDYDTDSPVITFYETDGTLNTDRIPRPVDVKSDILLPTALCAGGAALVYAALRVIRYLCERREKQGKPQEESDQKSDR